MRGGKRAGSGRKMQGESKRVTFACRVAPETKEIIDIMRGAGMNVGREIDRWAQGSELYRECVKIFAERK